MLVSNCTVTGTVPCLVSATFSLWVYWIIQQQGSSSLIHRKKTVSQCACVCVFYMCKSTLYVKSPPGAVCVSVGGALQRPSNTASDCSNWSFELCFSCLSFTSGSILCFLQLTAAFYSQLNISTTHKPFPLSTQIHTSVLFQKQKTNIMYVQYGYIHFIYIDNVLYAF